MSIKITLAYRVVQPLLPVIEAQANELRTDELLRGDVEVFRKHIAGISKLNPTLMIDRSEFGAVLRACAHVRVSLWTNRLQGLSIQQLEAGNVDPEKLEGETKNVFWAYLFLATIQASLLECYPVDARRRTLVAALWKRLFGAKTEVAFESEVVVRNDPVNLMNYVTAVFNRVLSLPAATAKAHMLTVHERRECVVWQGSDAEAEAIAAALRRWALTAEVRPRPAPAGSC